MPKTKLFWGLVLPAMLTYIVSVIGLYLDHFKYSSEPAPDWFDKFYQASIACALITSLLLFTSSLYNARKLGKASWVAFLIYFYVLSVGYIASYKKCNYGLSSNVYLVALITYSVISLILMWLSCSSGGCSIPGLSQIS